MVKAALRLWRTTGKLCRFSTLRCSILQTVLVSRRGPRSRGRLVDSWSAKLLAHNRGWTLEVRSCSKLPHLRCKDIAVVCFGRGDLFASRLYRLAVSRCYVFGHTNQLRSDGHYSTVGRNRPILAWQWVDAARAVLVKLRPSCFWTTTFEP